MSWRSTRAAGQEGHRNRQVAVVDLGSNSWRLVVFTYSTPPAPWWKLTDELYETVRIGAGLAASGRLSYEAIGRGQPFGLAGVLMSPGPGIVGCGKARGECLRAGRGQGRQLAADGLRELGERPWPAGLQGADAAAGVAQRHDGAGHAALLRAGPGGHGLSLATLVVENRINPIGAPKYSREQLTNRMLDLVFAGTKTLRAGR